jgi:hypothetical protein
MTKIELLIEAALDVVKKHNEGTLAGPNDSSAIMELERLAKVVEEMINE